MPCSLNCLSPDVRNNPIFSFLFLQLIPTYCSRNKAYLPWHLNNFPLRAVTLKLPLIKMSELCRNFPAAFSWYSCATGRAVGSCHVSPATTKSHDWHAKFRRTKYAHCLQNTRNWTNAQISPCALKNALHGRFYHNVFIYARLTMFALHNRNKLLGSSWERIYGGIAFSIVVEQECK